MALIFLTGLSGCGKSTVGSLLAARLQTPFSDCDSEVERLTGKTIGRIFTEEGEGRFRLYEEQVIDRLARTQQGVVALGAGALERLRSLLMVRKAGTLVYLRAELQTLVERLSGRRDRPLLAEAVTSEDLAAKLERMLARREAVYLAAEIVVDTDGQKPEEIVETLLQELKAA